MRVLVSSDETGLVKEIICTKGTDTSKKDGVKPESINKLCNQPQASLRARVLEMIQIDNQLVTLRINGDLCFYDMTKEDDDFKLIKSLSLCEDKPVSLVNYSRLGYVIAAFETNKIFIVDLKLYKHKELIIPYTKKVKPIVTFVENPYKDGEFAFGGEENDVKIIKLFDKPPKSLSKFTIEVVKTFRNVPDNHLDLRVPISIKGIRFLEKEKFITVTKYGQLRIYDMNNERPLNDFKIGDKPIIQLTLCNNNSEVILSDTTSLIGKYSLTKFDSNATKINTATSGTLKRPSLKLLGKYSEGSNTGATHAIHNFEGKYVGCGGLDRYLRIYDLESRELVVKAYIGTQISSLIILEDDKVVEEPPKKTVKKRTVESDDEDNDESDESESDDNDIWDQLLSNVKTPQKTQQKTQLKKKQRKI